MKKLIEVNVGARTAACVVEASNRGGSRSIGIAYFVPSADVLDRLVATPIGTAIDVTSKPSSPSAPCAMTMVDFSLRRCEQKPQG